jgi:hypothetical protein
MAPLALPREVLHRTMRPADSTSFALVLSPPGARAHPRGYERRPLLSIRRQPAPPAADSVSAESGRRGRRGERR